MQIIVTQAEIEEAVKETVLQQIALRDDQTVTVSFDTNDNDEVIAVIDVRKATEDSGPKSGPKTEEPKKRGRKPAAVAAIVTTATASSETEQTEEDESQEQTETASAETKGDAPWEGENQEGNQATTEPIQAASTAAPKIFPEIGTSAPATQTEEPSPAATAKSLFANLTKPTH